MDPKSIKGRINSIQSLGTLDGPGVRFVVFMQGCPLRCGCCHNPDTWEMDQGTDYSAEDLAQKAERFREYFGKNGGITVSGGEPLIQAVFVEELFKKCKEKGINTCLDTSGCVLNDEVKALLKYTDRVLLDIKYTNNDDYIRYVGCGLDAPINFLGYLNQEKIPVTLRQVIIPTVNDTKDNISALKEIAEKYSCVDKVELLPFKKLCVVKYQKLGIEFPFSDYPEPKPQEIEELYKQLNEK